MNFPFLLPAGRAFDVAGFGTNAVDFLYLGLDRFAKPIPRQYYGVSRRPDLRYRQRLRTMSEDLALRGGYVVYFNAIKRPWLPTEEQLRNEVALTPVHAARDGTAYRLQMEVYQQSATGRQSPPDDLE